MTKTFETFFADVAGPKPWKWQRELARDEACVDRLIRIPTGFGKTVGVTLSWLYHRVHRNDSSWPLRLVLCLPMRVLVEQSRGEVERWLEKAGLAGEVGVHPLLGGVEARRWLLSPEKPAVLVGTQDMLLSRALMRGYGSARGLWPMEFGLLSQDSLWVFDEVQLMGVGLATSAQLAAFYSRAVPESFGARPNRTWWMSATLQPVWLATVDHGGRVDDLVGSQIRIAPSERRGGLFSVSRRLERDAKTGSPDAIAELVRQRHAAKSLTLVIMNTVRAASDVAAALTSTWTRKPKRSGRKADTLEGPAPEIRLVHSRFRGIDRRQWAEQFLSRAQCSEEVLPPGGRIIVATQVVEAGVDVSARLLVTELAPWSSLVQRFGRCARYASERGEVVVVGEAPDTERDAVPYTMAELAAAARALKTLGDDAGPAALEAHEEDLPEKERERIFGYRPTHVLRRKDLSELFDTTPDLNGADLDVGRFVRDGDERDVSVFWRDVDPEAKTPENVEFPARDELCPAPLFGDQGLIKAWLEKGKAAWTFDYLSDSWIRIGGRRRPAPGMTVLLSSSAGGYSELGWDPRSTVPVPSVQAPTDVSLQRLERAASGQDADSMSEAVNWLPIAEHGRDVAEEARRLCGALGVEPRVATLLELAGRWHDAGKVHPVFQRALLEPGSPTRKRNDWAKAPASAWKRSGHERPGFRHELASTLMLLEAARRGQPSNLGLADDLVEHVKRDGPPDEPSVAPPVHCALIDELAALAPVELDLVAYLVCAHHGKVRLQWSPSPRDEQGTRLRILGVDDGEALPEVSLWTRGGPQLLPSLELHLDCAALGLNWRYGRSWVERVEALLERFGPFRLGFLEALLRVADWKASQALGGKP